MLPPRAPIRGDFRELPGPPPQLDARRLAFRAVMRRLLSAPQDPEPTESAEHEEHDEAA